LVSDRVIPIWVALSTTGIILFYYIIVNAVVTFTNS
jgi:hypothetical protein